MQKTNTIKQRRVDVYLNTLEQKERWAKAAQSEGTSLSKWVIQIVENSLSGVAREENQKQLRREIHELKDEISALRDENRRLLTLVER